MSSTYTFFSATKTYAAEVRVLWERLAALRDEMLALDAAFQTTITYAVPGLVNEGVHAWQAMSSAPRDVPVLVTVRRVDCTHYVTLARSEYGGWREIDNSIDPELIAEADVLTWMPRPKPYGGNP